MAQEMQSGSSNRYRPYAAPASANLVPSDPGSSRGRGVSGNLASQTPALQIPPPHQLQPLLDKILSAISANSAQLTQLYSEQDKIKTALDELVQS